VLSFTEALAEELVEEPVTVSCLCPGPTKTEFADIADMNMSKLFRLGATSAKPVAEAGFRGFREGKVVVVPGIRNKVSAVSHRFAPRSFVRRVVKKLQE
jgi:hypothetical protein